MKCQWIAVFREAFLHIVPMLSQITYVKPVCHHEVDTRATHEPASMDTYGPHGNSLLICMQVKKYARQQMKAKFRLELHVICLQAEQSMLRMLDLPSKPLPHYATRVIRMSIPHRTYKRETKQVVALGTTPAHSEQMRTFLTANTEPVLSQFLMPMAQCVKTEVNRCYQSTRTQKSESMRRWNCMTLKPCNNHGMKKFLREPLKQKT